MPAKTTTTNLPPAVAAVQAHMNRILNEYAVAVASGDRTRHANAAQALDAMVLSCAWDDASLDLLSDYVDDAPLTIRIADEPGVRFDGTTLHVEHTSHVRGGVHETVRGALRALVSR